ncbi:MAG TPA: endo-1,4-beta-xylanase [Thermoleptolyngbya sp. M55_K2018_002]|nr:endo-1,4-beta-xylanase [Thermoleptolyngbya sp. M55_K2018_002]
MSQVKTLSRRDCLLFGLGTVVGIGLHSAKEAMSQSLLVSELSRSRSITPEMAIALESETQSLKQRAAAKGLFFGAAARHRDLLSSQSLANSYIRECSVLVPEWELKWAAGDLPLRPNLDRFDFTRSDEMLRFARANGLSLRGHALVWHLSNPRWLRETLNPSNAEQLLTSHIRTVAAHFAGQIHSWDVVNEAIEVPDGRSDGLRNSLWLESLGEAYIDLAFRLTAQVDSRALRVYNDYGLQYATSSHESKRKAALKLMERLIVSGTPVQAFGIQSHLRAGETRFDAERLRRFLKDLADLGLKILITELDVSDQNVPANPSVRDRLVADAYREYLDVVLDEPAVIGVVTWGLSDRHTWLSGDKPREDGLPVRPLPLDENLERKPAWWAIAQAFDNAPLR